MTDDHNAPIPQESFQDALLGIASESWRFAHLFERMLQLKHEVKEQSGYLERMRWYVRNNRSGF